MREIEELKYDRKVLLVCCLVFVLAIIFLGYNLAIAPYIKHNPKIDYSDLNSSQKIKAERMIANVKEIYLNSVNSIKFVDSQEEVKSGLFGTKIIQKPDTVAYANIVTKRIVIYFTDDMEWNERVLSHEFVHIITGNTNENYAYDLMDYKFIFKNAN